MRSMCSWTMRRVRSVIRIQTRITKLAPGLDMYSGLPASSWLTRANLDTIKERNKPKDQVKTADAPFFLPTVGGVNPELDTSVEGAARAGLFDVLDPDAGSTSTRITIGSGSVFGTSKLIELLRSASQKSNYESVMRYFKSLSPSAIDAELRTLAMDLETEEEEMNLVLEFFRFQLESCR
eukprot:295657_1